MTTTHATHRSPNPKELDRAIPSRALPALLDFWTLCDFIGFPKHRSTRLFAWRGAKNGSFPAPVKLSEARIAWRRDEVERWLAERPRAMYSKATEPKGEAEPPAEGNGAKLLTITQAPTRCAMCDAKLVMIAPLVYSCSDEHGLGCTWAARLVQGDGDAV